MSSPLNLEAFIEALGDVGFVVKDAGLLASALERPHATLYGKQVSPTLAEKAASLGHAIAKYHPMRDGNKRSAWIGMNIFLELNGFDLDTSVDDAFSFVLNISRDRIELPAFASRLEAHMRPLT
jgi:death-on-curing protein